MRFFTDYPYWGNTVSVSLDHKLIAAKLDDLTGGVWDVETGSLRYTFGCADGQTVYTLLFFPRITILYCLNAKGIQQKVQLIFSIWKRGSKLSCTSGYCLQECRLIRAWLQ